MKVGGQPRGGIGSALEDQIVAFGNRVALERHPRLAVLHGDELEAMLRLRIGQHRRVPCPPGVTMP